MFAWCKSVVSVVFPCKSVVNPLWIRCICFSSSSVVFILVGNTFRIAMAIRMILHIRRGIRTRKEKKHTRHTQAHTHKNRTQGPAPIWNSENSIKTSHTQNKSVQKPHQVSDHIRTANQLHRHSMECCFPSTLVLCTTIFDKWCQFFLELGDRGKINNHLC